MIVARHIGQPHVHMTYCLEKRGGIVVHLPRHKGTEANTPAFTNLPDFPRKEAPLHVLVKRTDFVKRRM